VAGDKFNWDIVVRLATVGARQAKGDIEGFSTAVDEMARTGKVSEIAAESATRATIQQGRAAKTASADVKQMETSIISLRYANYDLATSMLSLSAGITAAGGGVVTAFASQESAFTNVERTADGALGNIRQALVELSTQIPLTFNELAGIATLGNQLGIGADQLEAFTTTVAQFSAVTGISAEESAIAFGKLGNLLGVLPDDYDRLGSAIALVGRTTAATDAQIISTARELAATAAGAGFTADQVIGLSGALASLGVPPERARSTILQFFETLNMATAEGGQKLEDFASIVGVTSSELESMVRSGQGESILQRFVGSVSTQDTVAITTALENLGLAGLRTNPTIRAMANNFDLVSQSIATGEQGFRENTELQRQMAFVLDDLATKWKTFINAATNAAAAIGSSIAPALGTFLDILKDTLIGLTAFASSEFGQALFRMVGIIGTAVAAYAALRGGIALASASLQAFSLISNALGGAGILAGLRGLSSAFTLVTGSSIAAAGGVSTLQLALTRLLAASGVGAVLLLIGIALTDLRGTALNAINAVQWLLDTFGATAFTLGNLQGLFYGIVNVINFLAGSTNSAGQTIALGMDRIGRAFEIVSGYIASTISVIQAWAQNIVNSAITIYNRLAPVFQAIVQLVGGFVQGFVSTFKPVFDIFGAFGQGFAEGTAAFGDGLNAQLESAREWANTLPSMLGDIEDFTPSADSAAAATAGWGDAMGGLGDNAGGAAREIRTLVDYGNDLQSVFSRAFDLRFSGGSTLDAITSTFITMREASAEAARNIARLKAEIQGLQSDLNIQKIFLGVAIEYGDTARAEAIQANIAQLQADLADKTANLSDEQSKNSKTLVGNSKAAIANRTQMEELVKQYQAHLVALASSGLSQADLARKTAELRAQFIQQATQLGYSRTEVEKYAKAFDDMRLIIARVPRNITLSVNANPAIQALSEYEAALNKARANAGRGVSLGSITNPTNGKEVRRAGVEANVAALIARLKQLIAAGQVSGSEAVTAYNRIADLVARLKVGNYASGGYTGAGGKYEPAGIVHRGEYVVPKKDVNQRTGLPYADAMGRLQRGASGPGYAGGGFVRGGGSGVGIGQIASYGPMAMQQQAQLFAEYMKVYLDGQRVADNSARQYAHSTSVGGN